MTDIKIEEEIKVNIRDVFEPKDRPETFKKNDTGKPDLSLFEPTVMDLYCEASAIGVKKYGRGNWVNFKIEDVPRYVAAFNRHFYGYKGESGHHGFLRGEQFDKTDGQRHLASAIWCLTTLNHAVETFGYEAVYEAITGTKLGKKYGK
jgi:hypothetical protein